MLHWQALMALCCAALAGCQAAGSAVARADAAPWATAADAVASAPALAWQRVQLPLPSGEVLPAFWLPATNQDGRAPQPAVVALHGCGGLYARSGSLSTRYRETGARLHAAGYGVLLPDSLGARGVREICSTRYGARTVSVALRVQDARAATAWLAAQPGVDAQRIGVQGWSNGASTALQLLAQRQARPDTADVPLAGVAVFYPGCGPLLRRQAVLAPVPLLMQLGALDDWTPAQPCVDLAQALQAHAGRDVTVHVYPGSYHGFDGRAPLRLRSEVPNGTSPEGVHQGGNPQARVQALAALDAFWRRVLAPSPQGAP